MQGLQDLAALATSTLVLKDQGFRTPNTKVGQYWGFLKDLASRVEHQVDSLAKVALQNRRDHNSLFMKQRVLCMAPGETCCFCPSQPGMIGET